MPTNAHHREGSLILLIHIQPPLSEGIEKLGNGASIIRHNWILRGGEDTLSPEKLMLWLIILPRLKISSVRFSTVNVTTNELQNSCTFFRFNILGEI